MTNWPNTCGRRTLLSGNALGCTRCWTDDAVILPSPYLHTLFGDRWMAMVWQLWNFA